MLAMLVTTTLVILGVTSLPTYAAAPTLKLAINADEDSYLSGVEQRYVVEFSCASTTEGCLNSVVTITLPHTITPAGNSNPDSAPDGVNARPPPVTRSLLSRSSALRGPAIRPRVVPLSRCAIRSASP